MRTESLTPARSGLVAAALASMLAASCVVDTAQSKRGTRGMPVQPARTGDSKTGTPGTAMIGSGAALPPGPVATPVTNASFVSRVLVGIAPMGTIVYDGQVLPLVSGMGRFIACEEGEIPAWPTLLAQDDEAPAVGTRIAIYALDPKAGAQRTDPTISLPPGLLLERAADDEGFLVEQSGEARGRRIGKVAWVGGALTWLTSDAPEVVASHAVILDGAAIAYVRRRFGDSRGELVLRPRDGSETVRRDPAASYVMPISTGDRTAMYALIQTSRGLDIEAISLEAHGDDSTLRFGSSIARRQVAATTDPALAYQITVSSQNLSFAPRTADKDAPAFDSRPTLLHPVLRRVVVFDARAAAFLPLVPDSLAAVPWATRSDASAARSGFFCATPEGLDFMPSPRERTSTADMERRTDAKVLAGAYVPRVTRDPDRPLVVFGRDPADELRLRVFALAVGVKK